MNNPFFAQKRLINYSIRVELVHPDDYLEIDVDEFTLVLPPEAEVRKYVFEQYERAGKLEDVISIEFEEIL